VVFIKLMPCIPDTLCRYLRTSVDLDFAPRGDVDFEDREVYAVEGGEEGYEADDRDDACTSPSSSAMLTSKSERGEEG
jgi:hypothetical protein